MNNMFGYVGVVNITDGVQSIKVHNAGGQGVAELFTRAVLGYPSGNCKPYDLDIVDGILESEDSLSEHKSILFERERIKTSSFGVIQEEIGGQYDNWKYPILDIIVQADNINISSYEYPGKDCTIVLFNNMGQIFAYVPIKIIEPINNETNEQNDTLYYHQGNNILIRWYMYLTNREITQENL